MNSKLNKKAWKIRRQASIILGCPIMDVSWKECLVMAKNELAKEEAKKKEIQRIHSIKETKAFFNELTILALILFVICAFGLFPEFFNHLGQRDKNLIGILWGISTPLSFMFFCFVNTKRIR